MKKFDQDIVTKRFSQLPESIQDMLLSEDMSDVLKNSISKSGLEDSKKKEFKQQITLVSVGLSTSKDFKEYLVSLFAENTAKVDEIYNYVTENIFIPIRNTLIKELENNKKVKQNTEKEETTDPYKETPTE